MTGDPTADPTVRRATPNDVVAVMRCFDGGLLETDSDQLRRWLASADAVEPSDSAESAGGFVLVVTLDERPVGAIAVATAVADTVMPADYQCVRNDGFQPAHIVAIAVRPSRQGRGLGRRLITESADRVAPRPLSATFDDRVAPFYAACGFDIRPDDEQLWGIRRLQTS